MRRRGVFRKSNSKGQMSISFGLIFAIIAGAFILFIAIYAVIRFTSIEHTKIEGETSTTIGILTNPLESSFEDSRTLTITTSVPTRIYTGCYNASYSRNYFGRQLINTSHSSHGKWTNATMNVGLSNKYIFSENPSEGRKFYVFSRTFDFPYKVADLIYVLSVEKEYCFLDADTIRNGDMEEEIENLNLAPMLVVADEMEECTENSTKVCFRNQPGCNVTIDYLNGVLRKGIQTMQFESDALMFAAIFTDKKTYECQVDRLMQRADSLADLYMEKSSLLVDQAGCDQGIVVDITVFSNLLKGYGGLSDLDNLNREASRLDRRNKVQECALW